MAPLLNIAFSSVLLFSVLGACSPTEALPVAKRAVATCPASVTRDGCITDKMAEEITDRWAEVFNLRVGGSDLDKLIACTTAEDIITFDKAFEFGQYGRGIQYSSRKEFAQIQQDAYKARKKDALQGGLFHTVYHIHNCDTITWRLYYNGTTSGIASPPDATNTVKGKQVTFYGIDILFIEKHSQRIKHVVTSADWYNMWWQTGMSFAGTPLCPTEEGSSK